MPDKLLDSEIVKALDEAELFLRNRMMDGMSLKLNDYDVSILRDISQVCARAYDEINRLQEEKQVLESRIGVYETCNARKDEAIRGLEAENERLKENNLTLEKCCDNCIYEEKTLQAQPCCECFSYRNFTPKDFLKLIKAEAYKECVEKVKEILDDYFIGSADDDLNNLLKVLVDDDIDNLLKELIGE